MSLGATYKGLRVLDLSTNLAGPFAAMILGDLGADVIKVERLPGGDDTRALPPRWKNESTIFLAVNRNKRSLALDIKEQAGRNALMQLVKGTDVLVESFPPGLANKLGLTFADFRAENPKIIVCSISAFGEGPIGSTLPGYDALVQAMSGMMSFTGTPGSPPVRLAPSVLDLSTGLWGALGIMASLARREVDGAQHVRPSLLDSAFAMMCHQVLGFLATGNQPEKLGSGTPSAVPYGVYEASDGSLMIATASDAQFERLCEAIGMVELVEDPRFRTMEARIRARDRLDTIIAQKISKEPVDVWLTRLHAAGISAGRVNDLKEALALPVTMERALFVSPERLGWAGGMPLLRLPIDTQGECVRRPPPLLGEHSVEILREANFDEAAIARLTAQAAEHRRSEEPKG